MPLYLLDANVLIRANTDYYPMDRVPQFWNWLIKQAENGKIKIPFEIYSEIAKGNDELQKWIVQDHVRDALVIEEDLDGNVVKRVFKTGYGLDKEVIDENELEKTGQDPYLIIYALMGEERVVVTKEVSKPSKKGGGRKVPDACDDCNIKWMDDFALYRALNFRIS